MEGIVVEVPMILRFGPKEVGWSLGYGGKDAAINTLGGKGYGLMAMSLKGMPVPPGFTITTKVCNDLYKLKGGDAQEFVTNLMHEVIHERERLGEAFGFYPLVSVRSGAPVSMPGMMDTILNVGLTTETMQEWEDRIGERSAWDSRRRLIQMLGVSAYGIDHDKFEFQLKSVKKASNVENDADLSVNALKHVYDRFISVFEMNTGMKFPDTVYDQLEVAIKAVFNSWRSDRAIEYRKINGIPEDMGTAVNIQAMVFGNMGNDSGSGVLFTRNPSTGENQIMAEYLVNAQGEDVVAGIRTPEKLPLSKLGLGGGPAWNNELALLCGDLEAHYEDMVDIEFTVQQGTLWLLQSRTGKRSAAAAFKIAYDLVNENMIDRKEALSRLTKAQYRTVRKPIIDPSFTEKPCLVGLPACPGIAVGKPVFSAQDAVNCKEPCILVTHETTPDDIAGMNAAAGILTQTGGATSHAAVVARAMDKPCIVGCTDLDISVMQEQTTMITIDGGTGRVWLGKKVPIIDASGSQELSVIGQWAVEEGGFVKKVKMPDAIGDQVVMLADIWNDLGALKQLISHLEAMSPRNHVTLDLRAPTAYLHKEDADLANCFGGMPYNSGDFDSLLMQLLEAAPIKDVKLAFPYSTHKELQLKGWGYTVLGQAKTIHDLLHGPVVLSEGFVDTICGDQKSFEILQLALEAIGKPIKVVSEAMPAEYAMFTALKG